VKLSVDVNLSHVNRDIDKVTKRIVPKIMASELNRTNKTIRGRAVKQLAAALGIKPQKRLRRRVFIPKGGPFVARPGKYHAGGLYLAAYIPEIYLHSGARAKRSAQGPNKFLASMDSGHTGLYKRTGRRRLPIREHVINATARAGAVIDNLLESDGADLWVKNVERRLRSALR
jgi:hypothetical protein